jgi:HEAT repeat protein
MKERAQPVLLEGTKSASQPVREVCVRALARNGLPGSEAPLLAGLGDRDYRVRFYAATGLAGYRTPAAIDALLRVLRDATPTVHLGAAQTLGGMASAMTADQSREALGALEALFREYGNGCRRPDAAWGWRVVGNAMIALGEPGRTRLEALRTQKDDAWLAWLAYEVARVPQSASQVTLCEEKDALRSHAEYAPRFPGYR